MHIERTECHVQLIDEHATVLMELDEAPINILRNDNGGIEYVWNSEDISYESPVSGNVYAAIVTLPDGHRWTIKVTPRRESA